MEIKNINIKNDYEEFNIDGHIFKMDMSMDAIKNRSDDFGNIYDDILYCEDLEDLIILYEKAFDSLFGNGSFNAIKNITGNSIYIMADILNQIGLCFGD